MLPNDQNDRLRILVVVLFAVLLRGVVCYLNFDSFTSDPDAYRLIAETLSQEGVYGLPAEIGEATPTAFRPPLYPYLLSWLTGGQSANIFIAAWHTLMGGLTVLLTILISRQLIDSDRVGHASLFAGVLVAIDPILVQQSTQVMTETIATLLATAVIWWWLRCYWNNFSWPAMLVLSGLLAMSYLCRPTFLVWAVMLVAAACLAGKSVDLKQRMLRGALVASLVVISVGGWMMRNKRAIGHPVWATSHGGYTLLLANNPSFYEYLENGKWGVAWDATDFLNAYTHRYEGDPNEVEFWQQPWDQPPKAVNDVSEHDDDRYCYRAARATIDRNPKMFVWSCFVRVGRVWNPLPHFVPGRSWPKIIVVGLFYLMIYVALLVSLWRIGRGVLGSKWWPIWALAITLCGVHSLYWTNARMRAPIIPAIAILAAGVITVQSKENSQAVKPAH